MKRFQSGSDKRKWEEEEFRKKLPKLTNFFQLKNSSTEECNSVATTAELGGVSNASCSSSGTDAPPPTQTCTYSSAAAAAAAAADDLSETVVRAQITVTAEVHTGAGANEAVISDDPALWPVNVSDAS
ncbi:hypothetical protein N1851_008161 [Merluccius polli]|uniref:Uncharacterized protein n=1 Tax=Merluccius polli TaxID=89951 RepID=A0AA47P8Y2_MERPO|nr:hypothetical protein N1851_008161 [Merluccius polli]